MYTFQKKIGAIISDEIKQSMITDAPSSEKQLLCYAPDRFYKIYVAIY